MATLTERRLVSWLGERFAAAAPEVRVGIGDDAAVLSPAAEPAIISVDASVDGVHFDRAYLGYEDIGYRAFQAAISDLAAMGAVPTAALSALILPRALPRTAVDELTAGQARASRETACPVVGGNISRGGELSITTTVLGRAAAPLCRSGARPGHSLWLIGEVGLAAAGLALLRITRATPTRLKGEKAPVPLRVSPDAEEMPNAGMTIWPGSTRPSPAQRGQGEPGTELGHEAVVPTWPSRGREGREAALARCVEAWRRPRARLEAGRELVGRASAAIDVSDGLAADARQLATASGVRIVVDQEQLRAALDPALFVAQRELRSSALRWALCGGEDYALLATGPAALRPACAVTIGYVARGNGAFLARSGRRVPLEGGFDHLRH